MKRCVFVGASLAGTVLDRSIVRFGPAQLGSVYQAAKAKYKIIGLVDGIFGNVPTVWHKEILYALQAGSVVYGSSSIGALRAAELHAYGMQGIGLCYRLYRASVITDDDEVALVHGDATTDYAQFSEPLVNARLTLRKLRRDLLLSLDQEREIIGRFKSLHFSQRTFPEYERIFISSLGGSEGNRIYALFRLRYRDIKREDANKLLRCLLGSPSPRPDSGFFLRTANWRRQFEEREGELSSLR
jgi:hypothetical protein